MHAAYFSAAGVSLCSFFLMALLSCITSNLLWPESSSGMCGLADKLVWPVQDPAMFTGSEVRIRDPDMPTIEFAVAFKGASWTDPDSVPLMVMQARQLGSLTACISVLVCHRQAGQFVFCPIHAGMQIGLRCNALPGN